MHYIQINGVNNNDFLLTDLFEIFDEIAFRFKLPLELVSHDLALPLGAGVDDARV